jgi:hypothetical protein
VLIPGGGEPLPDVPDEDPDDPPMAEEFCAAAAALAEFCIERPTALAFPPPCARTAVGAMPTQPNASGSHANLTRFRRTGLLKSGGETNPT